MAILYDFRCERRERLAYTTRKTNTAQEWPTRLSRPYSQLWKYRDDLIRDRRISHRVRFSERLRRDRNGRAECKRPLFWPGETKETMFDYSGRGARPSSSSSSKGGNQSVVWLARSSSYSMAMRAAYRRRRIGNTARHARLRVLFFFRRGMPWENNRENETI